MNYDQSIDILTEKLNKLTISVEKLKAKTSSHQQLLLDHVEKGDGERMNLKDDIQSEIQLTTEKMEQINDANLKMHKLSTLFSNIRSPIKLKEEIKSPFIEGLKHQDKSQFL
ncbi:hypothetical protein O181_020232 [Austropuccinia psidii MF-1]|uniref:Uncharacterized protein n=1 Tax=Austropuccinia psidii MF-1 TaxID=1389203 RepID=A0A9Q3CBA8_9BASI|nr:hypothetical protein [Austropuccinia psidii MF-1]